MMSKLLPLGLLFAGVGAMAFIGLNGTEMFTEKKTVCLEGTTLCPDGIRCVTSLKDCETGRACPPEKPFLCGDGACVGIKDECVGSGTLSPSGNGANGGEYRECNAGEHQIMGCEANINGSFNMETCECEFSCAYDQDCEYGFECTAGTCVESECRAQNSDCSVPAKECPPGLQCEFGDGVDYSHGNGQCVPE